MRRLLQKHWNPMELKYKFKKSKQQIKESQYAHKKMIDMGTKFFVFLDSR